MADLETPYESPVADKLGDLTLTLNDANGTEGGMYAQADARIMDTSGKVAAVRRGNPENFMPDAWKAKVKAVLDELRAEMAVKLNVDAS